MQMQVLTLAVLMPVVRTLTPVLRQTLLPVMQIHQPIIMQKLKRKMKISRMEQVVVMQPEVTEPVVPPLPERI